jgi:hypothetical protein
MGVMQRATSRFAFVDAPPAPPGLSLTRRQGHVPYLEADLDGGELFIDPARLLLRSGALTFAFEHTGLAWASDWDGIPDPPPERKRSWHSPDRKRSWQGQDHGWSGGMPRMSAISPAGAAPTGAFGDDDLVCVRGSGRVGIGHRAPEGRRWARPRTLQFVVVEAGAAVQLGQGSVLAATRCARSLTFRGGHGGALLLAQAPADASLLLILAAAGAVSYRELGPGESVDIGEGALLVADTTVDLADGDYAPAGIRCAFVQCLGPGGIALQQG